MDETGKGSVSGLGIVDRAGMVALLARDRAEHGEVVRQFRGKRQTLAEADALHGCGDGFAPMGAGASGMRIEALELADASLHPEDDDRLGSGSRFLRPAGELSCHG